MTVMVIMMAVMVIMMVEMVTMMEEMVIMMAVMVVMMAVMMTHLADTSVDELQQELQLLGAHTFQVEQNPLLLIVVKKEFSKQGAAGAENSFVSLKLCSIPRDQGDIRKLSTYPDSLQVHDSIFLEIIICQENWTESNHCIPFIFYILCTVLIDAFFADDSTLFPLLSVRNMPWNPEIHSHEHTHLLSNGILCLLMQVSYDVSYC